MYYQDMSDEELLEFPEAQEWKEEARKHWEKYLPNMCRELKAQRKLEQSLNRAVVNALRVRDRVAIARPERAFVSLPEAEHPPGWSCPTCPSKQVWHTFGTLLAFCWQFPEKKEPRKPCRA